MKSPQTISISEIKAVHNHTSKKKKNGTCFLSVCTQCVFHFPKGVVSHFLKEKENEFHWGKMPWWTLLYPNTIKYTCFSFPDDHFSLLIIYNIAYNCKILYKIRKDPSVYISPVQTSSFTEHWTFFQNTNLPDTHCFIWLDRESVPFLLLANPVEQNLPKAELVPVFHKHIARVNTTGDSSNLHTFGDMRIWVIGDGLHHIDYISKPVEKSNGSQHQMFWRKSRKLRITGCRW